MKTLLTNLRTCGITVWEHGGINDLNPQKYDTESGACVSYTKDRVSIIDGQPRKFSTFKLEKSTLAEVKEYMTNSGLKNFSLDDIISLSVKKDNFTKSTAHTVSFAAW